MSHQRLDKKSLTISVIGGGLGGLTAAARLARRGHKVRIFERSNRLGGKCHTEWIDGYGFDTGPSLLTIPAVYRDFFMKTGKPIDLGLTPVDPAFHYHFADKSSLLFPNLSHGGVLDAIRDQMGSEAAEQWHQLLLRSEKMWEASRNDFVERALPTFAQLRKRKNILRDLATIAPLTSLRKFTSKRVSDPRLQFIIDRYATYTGSDPRKAPAVMLTIAFVEEAFGAWHIKGGLGNLSQLVANRASELGVGINLNSEVVKIHDLNGEVSAIELANGEMIQSDLVISNIDSYHLYNSMLDGKSVKSEKSAVNKSTPSLSGFSILLGLKPGKDRAFKAHHTVFFPVNYDQEFDQIFKLNQPVTDPTIYICSPDDPQMVPTVGAENLFILINAPRHSFSNGFDWSQPEVVESYGEMIIDLIEAKGVKIRDRILVKKFRSPFDIENDYASLGGSIYGPSSNGKRAAFRRAPNKSALRGLYNVGGSAHPGGGLPLVGLSGEIVADLISESING